MTYTIDYPRSWSIIKTFSATVKNCQHNDSRPCHSQKDTLHQSPGTRIHRQHTFHPPNCWRMSKPSRHLINFDLTFHSQVSNLPLFWPLTFQFFTSKVPLTTNEGSVPLSGLLNFFVQKFIPLLRLLNLNWNRLIIHTYLYRPRKGFHRNF